MEEPTTPIADCTGCPHADDRLPEGRCQPGDACVRVRSGRQIDRFFRQNPDLARAYRHDPFWERRAITVRYLPDHLVPELIDDPDEAVRRACAARLSPDEVGRLKHDPDREVRITVADRITPGELESMVGDDDYMVRAKVAARLPPGRLFRMVLDPDRQVRELVARRIHPATLGMLADDPEPEVRRIVAQRIATDELFRFVRDDDWMARYIAAARTPVGLAHLWRRETDDEVREAIGHPERVEDL